MKINRVSSMAKKKDNDAESAGEFLEIRNNTHSNEEAIKKLIEKGKTRGFLNPVASSHSLSGISESATWPRVQDMRI